MGKEEKIKEILDEICSYINQLNNINSESFFDDSFILINNIYSNLFGYNPIYKVLNLLVKSYLEDNSSDDNKKYLDFTFTRSIGLNSKEIKNIRNKIYLLDKDKFAKLITVTDLLASGQRIKRQLAKSEKEYSISKLIEIRNELLEFLNFKVSMIWFMIYEMETIEKRSAEIELKFAKKHVLKKVINEFNPSEDLIPESFNDFEEGNENVALKQYKYDSTGWNEKCYKLFCYLVEKYKHEFISQKFTNIWHFIKNSDTVIKSNTKEKSQFEMWYNKSAFFSYIQESNPKEKISTSGNISKNNYDHIQLPKLKQLYTDFCNSGQNDSDI